LAPLETEVGEASTAAVTVYWRPGCGYCSRLLRSLERAGIEVDLRNIWEDDEARDVVRRHNQGDETVPTVAVGELILTNPEPKDLLRMLQSHQPHLTPAEPVEPFESGLLGRLRRH
jgi:mycoredoxin